MSSQQGNHVSFGSALKEVLKFHAYHIPTYISMGVVLALAMTMATGNADVSSLGDLTTRAAGVIVLVSALITSWRVK